MIWLTWPFGAAGALGGFGGTVVVAMIWRLLSGGLKDAAESDVAGSPAPVNYLRDVSTTVFVAAWIPLFGAFGVLMAAAGFLGWRLHPDALASLLS